MWQNVALKIKTDDDCFIDDSLKKLTAFSDPYVLFSKIMKYMLGKRYIFQLAEHSKRAVPNAKDKESAPYIKHARCRYFPEILYFKAFYHHL